MKHSLTIAHIFALSLISAVICQSVIADKIYYFSSHKTVNVFFILHTVRGVLKKKKRDIHILRCSAANKIWVEKSVNSPVDTIVHLHVGSRHGPVLPYARVSPSVGRQARLQQHVDHLFLWGVSGSEGRSLSLFSLEFTSVCECSCVTHSIFFVLESYTKTSSWDSDN